MLFIGKNTVHFIFIACQGHQKEKADGNTLVQMDVQISVFKISNFYEHHKKSTWNGHLSVCQLDESEVTFTVSPSCQRNLNLLKNGYNSVSFSDIVQKKLCG